MEMAYFDQYFATIVLGGESAIKLLRDDGVLLASHPQVNPARGRAGLLHHLERLVQAGHDPLAHPVQGVRVDRAGQQPVLFRGPRRHPVVVHDLRVGTQEQGGLREELINPLLIGEFLQVLVTHRASSSGLSS